MVQESEVLVVTAHPDDEIFASGTICLCAERGFKVTLVCATDGESGATDLLGRGCGEHLGELRRRELELSARILGTCRVIFLGEPDSASSKKATGRSWDPTKVVNTLAEILKQTKASVILTHGPLGGYGHPAHRLLHQYTVEAAKQASFAGSIFSFCGQVKGAFFSWHFDQPSDVLVDARSFLQRRAASLSYHQSQLNYFVQPHFPRNPRKFVSALLGYTFAFTEAGRKRVPIATARRFFQKFPIEGLALQKKPDGDRPHFFWENFANVVEVQINR